MRSDSGLAGEPARIASGADSWNDIAALPLHDHVLSLFTEGLSCGGERRDTGMDNLHPRLKINMIYFAGDTFYQNRLNVSAAHQISFDLPGTIYGKAHRILREALNQCCLLGQRLPDFSDSAQTGAELLLEGHLFESLTFGDKLRGLYVSRHDKYSLTGEDKDARDLTAQEWLTIKANAKAFGADHGVRVYYID